MDCLDVIPMTLKAPHKFSTYDGILEDATVLRATKYCAVVNKDA